MSELDNLKGSEFYNAWKKRFDKLSHLGNDAVLALPNTTFDEWIYYFKRWSEVFSDDYEEFKTLTDEVVQKMGEEYDKLDPLLESFKSRFELMESKIAEDGLVTKEEMNAYKQQVSGDLGRFESTQTKNFSDFVTGQGQTMTAFQNTVNKAQSDGLTEMRDIVNNKISQLDNGVHAYANAQAIRDAYPNGKDGIFVAVDTGHQWYYVNGQWVDGGAYQSASDIKLVPYDRVINSEIRYDSLRAWGGTQFSIDNDNLVTMSSSGVDKGVIFPLKNPTKYAMIRLSPNTEFSKVQDITIYKYDISASNHVGFLITKLNLSPNEIQTVPLPDNTNEILVASHGLGSVTFEIVASDIDGAINLKSDIEQLRTNSTDLNLINDNDVEGTVFDLNDVGTFGNATKSMSGGVLVADVKAANGGFWTGYFTANSEKVKIIMDGTFTQSAVTVQIGYYNTVDKANRYIKLANITGGKLKDVTFDASSAIIYQHADPTKFRVLIQSNVDSAPNNNPVGKMYLNHLSIYDPTTTDTETSLMYHYRLKNTLLDIIENLNALSTKVSTIPTDRAAYVTLPDGSQGKIVYANGALAVKPNAYKKVLLLGNSLLLGLSTNGDHGTPFGLTASNPQKDWAYLLAEKLKEKGGADTVTKLHDAPFEQAELQSESTTYINSNLAGAEKNNDLVIIQIGDNVNNINRRANFRAQFDNLVKAIKQYNPTADILIAGVWFDGDNLQSWLKDYASSHNCLFTPLHDLYNSTNTAKLGDTVTFADGVQMQVYDAIKTHPGDLGMQAIADRIFSTLYPG